MSLTQQIPVVLAAVCLCALYPFVRYIFSRFNVAAEPCYEGEKDKISPDGKVKADILLARKPTNRRLVKVFKFFTSAFVSADPTVHNEFKRAAGILLSRARDWTRLRAVSCAAAATFAPRAGRAVAFDEYIQAVTLATILCAVFSTPAHPVVLADLPFDDLVRVAFGITTLWTHSKSSLTPMPDELREVNSRLRRWIVKLPPVPRSSNAWTIAADDNPLEFIVPAFETLWRVVAVAFAEAHGNDRWSAPFLALASCQEVGPAAFRDDAPSVEDFIHEVLRLHPPTKRIERIWNGVSVKADVEAAQRNMSVWGADSQQFDPLRPKAESLLAFGAKPLECPGATWAPQAAGIIVAALLNERLLLTRGEKLGGRDGWGGWSLTA